MLKSIWLNGAFSNVTFKSHAEPNPAEGRRPPSMAQTFRASRGKGGQKYQMCLSCKYHRSRPGQKKYLGYVRQGEVNYRFQDAQGLREAGRHAQKAGQSLGSVPT